MPVDPQSVANISLFQGVQTTELVELCKILEVIEVEDGGLIIQSEGRKDDVFFIVKGRVQIELVCGLEERPKDICVLKAGDSIGEFRLVKDTTTRTANARARGGKVVLYKADAKTLQTLLSKNPKLGLVCYRNLATCLVDRLQASNSLAINFMR